ncbi:hypothetical protein NHF46_20090 [Arthrobacter alpinus]|nr:hypothetical protein [Arthrobacter alpinus]
MAKTLKLLPGDLLGILLKPWSSPSRTAESVGENVVTEEQAAGEVSVEAVIRQDIPWRMLFPFPLPPIATLPHLPANASAVDVTQLERQCCGPRRTKSAVIENPVAKSARSIQEKP